MKYVEVKSPFGGVGDSKEPARGRVCYFDPASIKVTLNDKVFTEDEIRNAKVYAVCGVCKGAKFGSTENYRKAIGLGESKITAACSRVFSNRPFDEAPFDGLCGYSDMMGMKTSVKFTAEDFDDRRFGVFGRGNENYLIEPQALHSGNGADWMPA